MQKLLVTALLVLAALVLSPLVIAQGGIRVHGGGAEVLVNDCAAVDRMDTQTNQAPIKDIQGIQYCFGYIFGVVDMRDILNAALPNPKDGVYCVPDNASATQLAKVVARYGNEHPEELNEAALLVASNAFTKSFPCK
jgi:hypothetical protein